MSPQSMHPPYKYGDKKNTNKQTNEANIILAKFQFESALVLVEGRQNRFPGK